MYDAVQKVSKSFLRRYTLPKLITLIINSFYSMLCRGVLQTPTQQTPAQQTPAQQTPAQQTPTQQTLPQQTPPQQTPTQQTLPQQTPPQQTPIQLKTVKYRVIANFSPSLYLLTSII